MRKRRYLVDGRLKLEEGDKVTVSATGRKMIKKNIGLTLTPQNTGTIERIHYDISERKFFATVKIANEKIYMPVSGLNFYSK